MTIQWGPYETAPSGGGTSGMRVGIEVTNSAVSNTSTTVTFTYKVYTQNYLAYTGDSQGLTFGGSYTGASSVSFSNSSATGAIVLRATKTYTYTYSSSSYGSSPGSVSFSATSYGAFDGTTASKSVSTAIPARPFGAPTAPTSVANTRNSDAQATVTWTRTATTSKPYTSLTVQMATFTGSTWGAWTTVATTSATATSYVKTGLSANRIYRFQVRANNSVGSSAYVAPANYIWNTPAAPTGVIASINPSGTTIAVSWTPQNYMGTTSTAQGFYVQRSVNGGAFATVATVTSQSATSWTDPTPGAGSNQYQVAAYETVVGSLTSAYTQSNTVTTIVPPLAPTALAPTGVTVDFTQAQVLTWQHNPGGDGAPQSAFTIETSIDAGANWVVRANNVASTASSWTMPANTLVNGNSYLWRVRTIGITSGGYGPNSASATLTGSLAPVVAITAPSTTIASLPITVTWTYTQAQSSAQSQWYASLFAADGTTVLETKTGTGTGLTTSFAYPAQDAQTYVIQVQSRSAAGILSNVATRTSTVALAVPAAVTIAPEYQECTGTVVLHLENSAPIPAGANRTNLFTNPSMRATSGTSEVRRNISLNPDYSLTGQASIEVRRNLVPYPRFAASSATVEVRRNLAVNPGSETGAWASNNGTTYPTSTDTTVKRSGTQSTKSTPQAGQNNLGSIFNVGGAPMAAVPGDIVTASVYLAHNSAAGASGSILISWLDAALTQVGTSSTTTVSGITGNSSFSTRLTVTGTAPAGTTQFRIISTVARGSGLVIAGEFCWWDDATIEKGVSDALPHFTGASTDQDGLDYQWTGTVDNSASIAVGNAVTGYNVSSTLRAWRGADGKSMRILVVGVGGFVELASGTIAAASVVGERWAFSADFSSDTVAAIGIAYATAGGTPVSVTGPGVATGPTKTRIGIVSAADLPASTTSIRPFFVPASATVGTLYTVRNLLGEKSCVANLPHFDGSSSVDPNIGLTPAWVGTVDASESTLSAPRTNATSHQAYLRSSWERLGGAEDGTNTTRAYIAKANQSLLLFGSDAPVAVVNEWIGARYKIRQVPGTANADITIVPTLRAYTSGSIDTGQVNFGPNVVVPADGTWVEAIVPPAVITQATAGQARLYTILTPANANGFTGIVEVSNTMIEKNAPVLGPWFSGNTADTAEFNYGWVGAAGSTASIITADKPAGLLAAGNVYQTSVGGKEWAALESSPGLFYLYASVIAPIGRFYAAQVRIAGPPGRSYSVGSSDNVVGSFTNNVIGVFPDEGEVVVNLTSTVITNGTSLAVGFTSNAYGMRMTDVLVMEVSDSGMNVPVDFFDGATPDISTYTYDWSGAANASTSVATGRAEIAVSSVSIERLIEGEDEWVTLVTGLAVPNDFIDPLPITNGINTYRVTAASAAPSYRVMEPVDVVGSDGQQEYGAACGGLWAFVSYGPGFQYVLRTHSDLKINETGGRTRSSQPFLGRKKPGLLVGTNAERKVSLTATLHYDDFRPVDDDCRYDSPPADWTDMGRDAELVCYRDYTGRRFFGMLSEVQADEVRWRILGALSLSVVETDYDEVYGSAD